MGSCASALAKRLQYEVRKSSARNLRLNWRLQFAGSQFVSAGVIFRILKGYDLPGAAEIGNILFDTRHHPLARGGEHKAFAHADAAV